MHIKNIQIIFDWNVFTDMNGQATGEADVGVTVAGWPVLMI